ncbi:metallophosphoesterase [Falsiroseomonas tokyonensis]|uniref:Metallophosphoesterase n=1 Tax=Falsiroseomonas tokyonensis TaxID=430521 RepID=A0ABV7BSW5_9PROT|nr:metallophosphoesterase [Falsiroseomonas tokyonensis]MBU8538271.1 serine/threonine protein phosphatase [Falsiroseomonas tokyonensis]
MASKRLIPGATTQAFLPEGLRIYAVGDSHRCARHLAALHRLILDDLAARPIAQPCLIHLGDHVDRGPDSAGVLAMLAAPPAGLPSLNLMGNHDQMMLDALAPDATAEAVELWLANGGAATLESYGARAREARSWNRVPAAHLDLLRACRSHHAAGGYVFVHAGLRPGIALEQQQRMDMLWIREPFLSWRGPMPAVVVHGHTPAATPEILPHRIGLDTGAVFGGPLTCGVLEGARVDFLQV